MEPLKIINRRLSERFGSDLEGNAFFRLVWTTSQLEVRRGYFPVGNTRIISGTRETREVKKYPLMPDRYALEKKCALPPIGELPLAELHGYSYEAIFVFHDKDGNPLEPVWRAIEIIVNASIHGPEKVFTSRTEGLEAQKIQDKEIEYFESVLENESPYLATMFHNREAVQFNSNKRFTQEMK